MSTTSEDEASGMKLHEVLFAPCLSARPLFSCHRSISRASARASARASVTGLLLVRHWSVAGLSLVCHWSVVGLLGSWPLVMVADRASLVHRSCVTRLPVPLSAGLLLVRRWPWPLLCLLLSRCSACLSVCWPVAFLSLVCLLARRCWSVADVSLVCLLVHHWLSLSCTCSGSPVYRSSICSCVCSCIVHPSLIHLFVRLLVHRSSIAHPSARASVRVRFACRWSVTPLSHESLTSLSRVSDGSVCSFVVGLSPRPAARVVVAAPWLVCHSSFTDPSLVMAARASARSSRVALPVALPVAFLSAVLSPVCLLGSWSLACSSVGGLLFVRHWPWSSICYSCTACLSPRLSCRSFACCSAIGPPLLCLLVCLLVRRWSVCWCVAGLSVGASLVCLLVHHWSICWCITGPSVRASLVYLLLCRWSVCSFVARPYVRVMSLVRLIIRLVVHRSSPIPLRWSAGPSARVMVGVSSLVHLLVSHWPVYWSRGHGSYRWSVCSLVTRPSVRVMSLVRLLESWSLVRLIGSWPLACSSVAGLLFVRRWPWSSICHWYIARASARLVVGVSLVCC